MLYTMKWAWGPGVFGERLRVVKGWGGGLQGVSSNSFQTQNRRTLDARWRSVRHVVFNFELDAGRQATQGRVGWGLMITHL